METRTTFLKTAVIAISIIVLISTTSHSAATSALDGKRADDLASAGYEADVKAETGLLSSLTTLSVVPGVYDLSFRTYRNGVMEPVSSLPILSHVPLVLFAHVEDTNGNPAQGGTVTFEVCGDYEPKENCDAGLARWTRLNRVSIGSCRGLPGYDPGPGNACLFVFDAGNIPGDDGFRFKYAGRKGGVDSGMSGAANFSWTAAL